MKIINKYIIKQLLIGFLLIALGMTGIIWLSQSLKMIDWIVNKGVSVGLFIELTFLVLPNFIAVITPLAFFVVLLFTYNRLLADRELVVMKAVGMTPWQLAKPALFLGIGLVGVGYFLTLWLVPDSVSRFKELQFKIRNDLAHVVIQEGEFNNLPNNVTAYVRVFRPSGELKGIFIHDARNPEKRVVLVAEDGLFLPGENGAHIIMHNGKRQEYDKNNAIFSSLSFDHYTMTLDDEKKSNKTRTQSEAEKSLFYLLDVTKETPNISLSDYREYKVEAFKRLTQPLYSFVYLVIALMPFLLGYYNRRGQNGRIYLAVGSVILIQSMALGFENLSNKNLIYLPLMGLNILLPFLFGILVLRRGSFWQFKRLKKLVLFLGIISLIGHSALAAQPQFVTDTTQDTELPATFEADSFTYDEKADVVTAQGNVVIVQDNTTLKTDKIIYDRKQDKLEAIGHVVITRSDGVVIESERAAMTDQMKQGIIHLVEMRLADGSIFKADKITRKDMGNEVRMKGVFFTPCNYCKGTDALWDIRAREVTHNYSEQEFTYRHAVLDVKGIPVFYWPYLAYPDFQVKRKTGFLSPSLASSTEMGAGVETPFFWAISDSQDLYISPIISASHVPLVQGQYRGLYQQSGLTFDFSATQDEDGDNQGHIKAHYQYDITDKLRFRGNYFRVSDDTYFRRYPIDNVDDQAPWIQSDATVDYFGTQDYAYVRVYSFQNLRSDVRNSSMPIVPQINYQYVTQPFYKGLYSFSQLNSAGVYRDSGIDSSRLSFLQGFEMPYISSLGAVFNTRASVRFDGYSIDLADQMQDETKNTSRVYPNVSVEMRYPFMQQGETYSQVLEPIIMGVWTPNVSTNKNIPNEDSLDYEFDDVTLFSDNRYNGYDRVETGTRLNYGLQWTLYAQNNTSVSGLIGQSYRFREDDTISKRAGFEDHFSSYVGRFNINVKDIFLNYRFRLNQDDLKHEMSEVTLGAGRDPFRIGISYLYLTASKENLDTNTLRDREEITLSFNSKLTRSWSTYGYYQYDLAENGGPIKAGGGLQYENECLILIFSGEKEFTKDRDYKGDTSFFVRAVLKTLGAV